MLRRAALWVSAPIRNQGGHMYISIGAAILIVILLVIFVF
jgi:hypothetical protein